MLNTSGRLFTFGCSITQYDWPTWADIAGTKWNKFENWGESGAGNQFIFNSIIECDVKNNLNSDDTVVVMWTGPARLDYFSGNRWGHQHFIFNTDNQIAYCPDGYWLTTFSFIHAINQIFKSRGISYKMVSWVNYSQLDSKFHSMFTNLLSGIRHIPLSMKEHCVPKLADIDNLTNTLYNALSGPDWPSLDNIKTNQYSTTPEIEKEIKNFWKDLKNDARVNISCIQPDRHPLPSEHFNIAKQLFPELEFDSTVAQWIKDLDEQLKDGNTIKWHKNLPDKSYYETGGKL